MTKYTATALVRRVTRAYRLARMTGAHATNWYADALETAETMAIKHAVPVHVAVGVISALSPRVNWGLNIRLAERMLASGGTMQRGCLTVNLRKARAIYAGADPLEVMTAPKTANFYRAIMSGGADGIVIDRHAYDIAMGQRHADKPGQENPVRPSLTPKQYQTFADAYTRASVILSREFGPVSPSDVQALTWEWWRAEHGIKDLA